MIYILKITSKIIAAILGLIFISISVRWSQEKDKHYKIVNINEFRDMHILNMNLRKRKAILEKDLIKVVLESKIEKTTEEQ